MTSDGKIAASTADADHYQLTVKGPGIFDAVFTFGSAEIAGPDGALVLPPVEVVARAPGRVEFFFGGDTMIGRRFEAPARSERALVRPESRAADMARLLDPMRPYFAGADLASLNLETVLATSDLGDAARQDGRLLHAQRRRGGAGKGRHRLCSASATIMSTTMSNPALAATTAALDRAKPSPGRRRPDEAAAVKAARLDVGGHPYAMLGFVGWKGKVEPNQVAEVAKGGAAFGSDENIAAAVAREVAAGRAPVVQYHGSSEYSDRLTDISERRMKLAIDEGAVLVVSHHPHVAHGLELYKGTADRLFARQFPVRSGFPRNAGDLCAQAWMDGDRLFRAEIIPIQILDYRPVPAVGGMRWRRCAGLSTCRPNAAPGSPSSAATARSCRAREACRRAPPAPHPPVPALRPIATRSWGADAPCPCDRRQGRRPRPAAPRRFRSRNL